MNNLDNQNGPKMGPKIFEFCVPKKWTQIWHFLWNRIPKLTNTSWKSWCHDIFPPSNQTRTNVLQSKGAPQTTYEELISRLSNSQIGKETKTHNRPKMSTIMSQRQRPRGLNKTLLTVINQIVSLIPISKFQTCVHQEIHIITARRTSGGISNPSSNLNLMKKEIKRSPICSSNFYQIKGESNFSSSQRWKKSFTKFTMVIYSKKIW